MSNAMTVRASRRETVLEPVCDFLLANGLDASNLRALAKAAGTSDRMLLYYFADKDDLLAAALDRLAERLASKLDALAREDPMPPDKLATTVWSAICEPDLWPYMILFVELTARAARVGKPFDCPARSISQRFRAWLANHVEVGDSDNRDDEAERILTLIDGWAVLRMANRNGWDNI